MLKKILLVFVILVFVPGMVSAQKKEVTLEIEGRFWMPELDGKLKVTSNDIGTDIDVKDDLDIKDENYSEARITWYTGPKSKIRLAYTQVSYEGDNTIDRQIQFGGETYNIGTRVDTNLDLRYLRLGWAWQFLSTNDGVLKFGTLLEVKGFWVKASLNARDLTPPIDESETFWFALPTIGLALDINPHKMVNIFGEASGLTAGSYGYMYDAEAGIKLIPIKILSIMGGYRVMEFKAEDKPDYARVRVHGPFVGVTVRF